MSLEHVNALQDTVAQYATEVKRLQGLVDSLREQLRLTNDKMEERARQARRDTAHEIRTAMFPLDCALTIEEANAPKD